MIRPILPWLIVFVLSVALFGYGLRQMHLVSFAAGMILAVHSLINLICKLEGDRE